MKRSFREMNNIDEQVEKLAMANCASILVINTDKNSGGCAFKCKKCNRHFTSFQALGGHVASHKKHKAMTIDLLNQLAHHAAAMINNDNHQCSKCGLKFGTGQALGGHMRSHRGDLVNEATSSGAEGDVVNRGCYMVPAVLKKSISSSKKIICLDLKLGW